MAVRLRVFDQLRRRDPSSRIQDAARRHARRNGNDAEVCAGLTADLSGMPRVALLSEIAGWHPRRDYLNDRAYRLLVGVRDGGVVPPIDQRYRDNFAREAVLGRLPMQAAYAQIAASRPQLVELERRVRADKRWSVKQLRQLLKETRLDPTGTPGRTEFGLITQYLKDCARGSVDPTPFFDRDVTFQTHGSIGASPR
jgi:hypothetical protein